MLRVKFSTGITQLAQLLVVAQIKFLKIVTRRSRRPHLLLGIQAHEGVPINDVQTMKSFSSTFHSELIVETAADEEILCTHLLPFVHDDFLQAPSR